MPFAWLMMDPSSASLIKGERWDNMELVKKIYGEWLDIFDDLLGGDNIRKLIPIIDEEYYCKYCSHFNERGNALIAKVLTPYIKRKIYEIRI